MAKLSQAQSSFGEITNTSILSRACPSQFNCCCLSTLVIRCATRKDCVGRSVRCGVGCGVERAGDQLGVKITKGQRVERGARHSVGHVVGRSVGRIVGRGIGLGVGRGIGLGVGRGIILVGRGIILVGRGIRLRAGRAIPGIGLFLGLGAGNEVDGVVRDMGLAQVDSDDVEVDGVVRGLGAGPRDGVPGEEGEDRVDRLGGGRGGRGGGPSCGRGGRGGGRGVGRAGRGEGRGLGGHGLMPATGTVSLPNRMEYSALPTGQTTHSY